MGVSQASVSPLSVLPQSCAGDQGIYAIKRILRRRRMKITHTCSQIVQFQGLLTLSWFFESILRFLWDGSGGSCGRTSSTHTNPALPRASHHLSWAWFGTHLGWKVLEKPGRGGGRICIASPALIHLPHPGALGRAETLTSLS